MGVSINKNGHALLKHGGADHVSDDDLLVLEIAKRAPGMPPADLKTCFIKLRQEFGEDALRAIRTGHVQFEERVKDEGKQ